jgi:DNA-binding GntR family transcriptional regulator
MTKSIEKKVLSEHIKEQIMEAIFEGEFKPGERLVESVLARHYGVSHAPIREALKSLHALRLVDLQPYKGAIIRGHTKEDMKEFFVVRSCLEGLAGRIAARASTQEDIDDLQSILDAMIRAAREGDLQKRVEMNENFHKRLIAASRNSLLIETTTNLRLNSWTKFTASHSRLSPVQIARRHQVYIDLLKARNADGLEQAIKNHIRETFQSLSLDFLPNYDE